MPHFSNTQVMIPLATVARTPDLRMTPTGKAKCELLVAVDRGYDRSKGTDWFSITVWGKSGENCAQYLQKGARISVSGHLRGEFYETKDGQTRRSTEIVGDSVNFISRARSQSEGDLPSRQVQTSRPRVVKESAGG